MSGTYLSPSPAQLAALQAAEIDGPIVMLNLLRFAPDGGEREYRRYGEAAGPFLASAGASIRYLGNAAATVIGAADEDWDEVILVEYPSKQAFFEMTGNPDYPSDIRAGALLDSRLYCTVDAMP